MMWAITTTQINSNGISSTTALATDINVIHALGDLFPFLQLNIFLHHRQQHQLLNTSPSYTHVPITLF